MLIALYNTKQKDRKKEHKGLLACERYSFYTRTHARARTPTMKEGGGG